MILIDRCNKTVALTQVAEWRRSQSAGQRSMTEFTLYLRVIEQECTPPLGQPLPWLEPLKSRRIKDHCSNTDKKSANVIKS